jgi:hypothetical protein
MTYSKPDLVVLEAASVAIASTNTSGDKNSLLSADAIFPSSHPAYEADE